jgi:hypothetical protein
MHTADALKIEITSGLDRLPLASLRTHEPEAVERYVAAYREAPETDEESAVTYAMSQEALAEEPWE